MTTVGDCEAISAVGLAQPVNSITGAIFAIVAAVLVIGAVRRRMVSAAAAVAFGIVANAVGTVAYHGRPGAVSHWIHDVALVLLLGTIAGWHLGRIRDRRCSPDPSTTTRWGSRGAWIATGVAAVVGGTAIAITHDATTPLAMAAIIIIVIAEVVARRRGLPAGFGWGLAAVIVAALAAYGAGRSDSPLCDPGSIVQFHALWHVLIGVAGFVWADRALAAHGPAVGSGVGRSITDTVVGGLATVLVRAFHREVDIIGRHRLPASAPVLFVVNHGNGFVDPLVLAATLHRLPRFIAKAALWKIPPARLALNSLAVLPVYRRSDGDDPHGNDRTFRATTTALLRRDRVAIFPEGTTADRAGLDTIRSGAARIALGAADAGVSGIVVVPVGLAFESRVTTRSRVAVHIGEPIDLDAWRAAPRTSPDGGSNGESHPETHRLTEQIRTALTEVSPVYASVDEREQLRLAAAVSLQAEHGTVPGFGMVEERAAAIAGAPDSERTEVTETLAHHALRREMVGLSDADLMPGPLRRGGLRLALATVVIAIFGPVLVTAAIINLPVIVAVQVAVMAFRETATKGTVRLLVGLVMGSLVWWVAAMMLADGVAAVVVTMVGLGIISAIALMTWEWVIDGFAILRMWFRRRDRAQLVAGLAHSQALVAAAVDNALAASSPTPIPGGDQPARLTRS
jgi:glycerol-3-phosphate O-acyltransferase/dihydroxyacetone phosphate acyltransferase